MDHAPKWTKSGPEYTKLPLRTTCNWSAMTSNVDIEDLSSGMTCLRFHEPQAY